jgi:para-aminobenzoate synthetase
MPGYFALVSLARVSTLPSAATELRVRRLDALPDAERAFVHIYGGCDPAFWLDSSSVGERGRFSFLGAAGGPLSAVVTYDVGSRQVRVARQRRVEVRRESIFDFLATELRRLGAPRRRGPELPFEFDCGFVGYLGYELKADCDGGDAHAVPTPDAAFVLADRLIALDHVEARTYLLCLCEPGDGEEAESWLDGTEARLAALPSLPDPEPAAPAAPTRFELRRSPRRYLEDVEACRRRLVAGETYEVCLTNEVLAAPAPPPLPLYRALRRVNPAPYASFLRFGELAVLSSSPERFLGVDRDGWAEARPIKGTIRRGKTPAEDARLAAELQADAKSRAENVTIVDLLRNDLGRVCEYGTVTAPELMRVETYETVHQLVSAVRGRLRAGVDAGAAVRACFPPGSMTGAPKRRTMEILDQLEGEGRGVYSGAIGYLGLGGGADFSVVIRSIVVREGQATIGMGGAIVLQSDAQNELREALLKAMAPARAIESVAANTRCPAPTPKFSVPTFSEKLEIGHMYEEID